MDDGNSSYFITYSILLILFFYHQEKKKRLVSERRLQAEQAGEEARQGYNMKMNILHKEAELSALREKEIIMQQQRKRDA